MKDTVRALVRASLIARIAFVCCLALPVIGSATAKQYPIEGTVTALRTQHETNGGIHSIHRTYTVKTPTRVFVLKCSYNMTGIHIYAPSECGGKKKIAIGDAIRLRVDKDHAYFPTDNGKEQKLSILSESVNEGGTAQAAKQP